MAERRRVDIRKILQDPDLGRELFIPTLQATQAREDIETTRDQAERAYYVVTQGEKTSFFRLVPFMGTKNSPEQREEMFVRTLRGETTDVRYDVPRRDFGAIEGAPLLAYDRLPLVADLFRKGPPLDPTWAKTAQGLATADDSQFVRNWWEVPREETGEGRTWVPFAKGGDFSRFYSDVYLVVNWTARAIAAMADIGRVQNNQFYFRSGLTWPRRTAKGFNLRRLPSGCIFADKGPALFFHSDDDEQFLLGVCNTVLFEFLFKTKTVGWSWEVGTLKSLPLPKPTRLQWQRISELARRIYDEKSSWDFGNEVSSRFDRPWLLRGEIAGASSVAARLESVLAFEHAANGRIQVAYSTLNAEVFGLYGVSASEREAIEQLAGERPPEVVWPQLEGKSDEQKRMEHVFRLLSFVTKRVVASDPDGIVPFETLGDDTSLIERIRAELRSAFGVDDSSQIETEIANELKKQVKGYRRANGIAEWLENVFFEYHASLYDSRPIVWHISSAQLGAPAAFNVLVDYLKFDANRMAKLRGRYLAEARARFRREAALASKENRTDARIEWEARLEEATALDRKLQRVEEGVHEGPDGGGDFRILTPWKTSEQRPRGWNPDLNDGVLVNIAPLQKAGVLRIPKVI